MHIANLFVSVAGQSILRNLNFELAPGSIHAIMGPNGSGKSTLAYALAGHPKYAISSGSICIDGVDITHISPDKRAQVGLFLASQYPVALPGVKVNTFLKEALHALTGKQLALADFNEQLFAAMDLLEIDRAFAYRDVHDGFSGGQKKRLELLQLLMLKPKVAILDEIDSGLDIDSLKIITRSCAAARQQNPSLRILLITHYQRVLEHVTPDVVHILIDGKLVTSGDAGLAQHIECKGYDGYRQNSSI